VDFLIVSSHQNRLISLIMMMEDLLAHHNSGANGNGTALTTTTTTSEDTAAAGAPSAPTSAPILLTSSKISADDNVFAAAPAVAEDMHNTPSPNTTTLAGDEQQQQNNDKTDHQHTASVAVHPTNTTATAAATLPAASLDLKSALPARPGFPDGLKVLLVDEDQTSLDEAKALLEECHFEVTPFDSAKEAIANLNKQETVYDVAMFAAALFLEGSDAAELQETSIDKCQLPVVLVANSSSISLVMRGVQKGAVDVLLKPLVRHRLINIWQHAVRKILGGKPATSNANATAAAAAATPTAANTSAAAAAPATAAGSADTTKQPQQPDTPPDATEAQQQRPTTNQPTNQPSTATNNNNQPSSTNPPPTGRAGSAKASKRSGGKATPNPMSSSVPPPPPPPPPPPMGASATPGGTFLPPPPGSMQQHQGGQPPPPPPPYRMYMMPPNAYNTGAPNSAVGPARWTGHGPPPPPSHHYPPCGPPGYPMPGGPPQGNYGAPPYGYGGQAPPGPGGPYGAHLYGSNMGGQFDGGWQGSGSNMGTRGGMAMGGQRRSMSYNVLDHPPPAVPPQVELRSIDATSSGPLGLDLKKSQSFLNLLENSVSHTDNGSGVPPTPGVTKPASASDLTNQPPDPPPT